MRKHGRRVTHAKFKRGIGFTQQLVIPVDQVWNARKPKYNGWQTGHGAHKSAKIYDRNRVKREFLDDE